ncbi:class I SAM-dependent methyltransferase [Mumia sp. Pv 4-285]|uniref:class I SAM-dependent methyltransferase n=1 Tax=Mumia qirimensis TaxID=3234852 RepID=UPI00351CC7D8
MPETYDPQFWEARYRAHTPSSANAANQPLVDAATDLSPGTALDAGCGVGNDAIWLASQGWTVTALDVAPSAVRRARERAAEAGGDVSARIDWRVADLTVWTPGSEHFDLVTSHYVHVEAPYEDVVERLARAVAPGGTLLVVGHDTTHHAGHGVDIAQAAAVLDRDQWEVQIAADQPRTAHDPHGHEVDLRDAVLRARRLV